MVRRRSSKSAMDKFNGNFLKLTQVLDGKNDKLLKQLQQLHDKCKEMLSFAHEYDFDENTPFNGYRTFVKMIAIYFGKLVELSEGTPSRKRIREQQEFGNLAELFVYHLSILDIVKKKTTGLEICDWDQEDSIDRQVGEKILSLEYDKIKLLYSDSTKSFWLCPSIRKFMNKMYLPLVLFILFPFKTSVKNVFDSEVGNKAYTDFAYSASLPDLKTTLDAGEKRMSRILVSGKALGRGTCKSMKFERQKEWTLNAEGQLVRRVPDEVDAVQVDTTDSNNVLKNKKRNIHDTTIDKKDPKTYVKVMYIHYGRKGHSPSDSLIFHAHGGGFISMSPKGHEGYLRRWSRKLKTPLLSVYYRLAPENPYPAAVQDVLDAYLFAVSGNERLKSLLGFQPKNIVLTGDSAGGHLSVALALILNDIRKQKESILMPQSLCIQYPCSNPFIGYTSPSRTLSVFDNLLSFGACHGGIIGYVGETIDYDNKASVTTGVKPWYRRGNDVVDQIISKHKNKLSDPYFNIVCSNHYDDLKDIKLFIQASEFDPLIDDSIQIAKKWKGFVKLDVIPDVNHGFLSLQDFSPEAKRGSKLSRKRIGQGLGIIKMDDEVDQ